MRQTSHFKHNLKSSFEPLDSDSHDFEELLYSLLESNEIRNPDMKFYYDGKYSFAWETPSHKVTLTVVNNFWPLISSTLRVINRLNEVVFYYQTKYIKDTSLVSMLKHYAVGKTEPVNPQPVNIQSTNPVQKITVDPTIPTAEEAFLFAEYAKYLSETQNMPIEMVNHFHLSPK